MVDNSSEFALFEKDDKPTRCNQGIISRNSKTVDFTGAVHDLDVELKTKLESKSNIKYSNNLGSKVNTKNGTKFGSKTSTKLVNKTSDKTNSISKANQPVAASSVFEPLYHCVGEDLINISDTCTSLLHDCYGNDTKYAPTNGIILDESSIIDQDQGR